MCIIIHKVMSEYIHTVAHGKQIFKNLALCTCKVLFDAIDVMTDAVFNSCPYKSSDDGVIVEHDIVYEMQSPTVCVLDRYYAPQKAKQPVMIIIHGGGFSSGDKKHRRALSRFFAHDGYSVFCVNFGLMGEYVFPQPIAQLVRAVNHIGDNADLYNIDTERIYITGDSSGAYYAAMLGAFRCGKGLERLVGERMKYDVSGLILNCGIYDLDTALENKIGIVSDGIIRGFFGGEKSARCMPTDFIDPNFPPTFLVYSDRDVFCKGQGEAMRRALCDCGVYTEYYKARHFYSNHCFCLLWRGEDASAANELMRSFARRLSSGKIKVD